MFEKAIYHMLIKVQTLSVSVVEMARNVSSVIPSLLSCGATFKWT
jgi:hypothetical protein